MGRRYSRIYLFGPPGCGKTALASRLSKLFDYEVISLDRMLYVEPGVKIPEWQATMLLGSKMRQYNYWIAEGSYLGWSDILFSAVDLVVIVRVPYCVALLRVLKRYLRKREFSLISTLRLCFKTLRAYYTRDFVRYFLDGGVREVVVVSNSRVSVAISKVTHLLCLILCLAVFL